MVKIMQVFQGADLRCGHDGLKAIALLKKVDLNRLEDGELAIFLNNKRDKVKVYGASNVFAYYKSPSGRIEMTMLQYIPKAFGANGQINFNKALEQALQKILTK